MGRRKKSNIIGLTIAINNNSVYIDFSSQDSIKNSIKNNNNKINDILNQIKSSKNSQKSQENDNTSTDPSNNNNNNIETYNPNTIKSNQREDMQLKDGVFSLDAFAQPKFSDDENDEFFNELNSDLLEQNEPMFNCLTYF